MKCEIPLVTANSPTLFTTIFPSTCSLPSLTLFSISMRRIWALVTAIVGRISIPLFNSYPTINTPNPCNTQFWIREWYVLEDRSRQVSPGIHTDNFPRLTPLRKRSYIDRRMSKCVIGRKCRRELFSSNCKSLINTVWSTMCTDCISSTNRGVLTGYHDYPLLHFENQG